MASQDNSESYSADKSQKQRFPSQEEIATAPAVSEMQGDKTGDSNSVLPNHNFMQAAMNGGDDAQRQQIMLQQAIQASLHSFISPAFLPVGIPGMNPPLSIGMPQHDQFNLQPLHQSQRHQTQTQQSQHGNGPSQFNSPQSTQQNPLQRPPSQISFSGYPVFQTTFPVPSNCSSVTSAQDASRKRKATESFPLPSKDFSVDDSTPRTMNKEEFDRLSPAAKRRYERNLREQQRSHQISQQIKQLRDVLSEAKVSFKPNKFSILVSVSEYIQQLQSQAIVLDADYQRLLETIRQTQEVLAAGGNVSSNTGAASSSSAAIISSCEEGQSRSGNSSVGHDDLYFSYNPSSPTSSLNGDGVFAQSIDYEQIFLHCPYPWALASLDGRVLSCNPKFAETVGATHHGDLVQQSLFLFIQNHQVIFEAMGDLLKRSRFAVENGEEAIQNPQLLFWCGSIVSTQDQRVSFQRNQRSLVVEMLYCFSLFLSLI